MASGTFEVYCLECLSSILSLTQTKRLLFFLAGISGVSWEEWWTYDGISGKAYFYQPPVVPGPLEGPLVVPKGSKSCLHSTLFLLDAVLLHVSSYFLYTFYFHVGVNIRL
jgi:hypothetical protein